MTRKILDGLIDRKVHMLAMELKLNEPFKDSLLRGQTQRSNIFSSTLKKVVLISPS